MNMLNSDLPVTLQFQLKKELCEKINSGVWKEGFKIPSEHELCKEYGISRTTVREVMNELAQSGYIVRKQGKGSYVAKPAVEISLTSYYSIAEDLKNQGKTSEFILLSFKRIEANASAAELFQIDPSEYLFEVIRLRTIEDQIFAWEKEMIPDRYMHGATAQTIIQYGLYPTIKKLSGLFPVESEERIEAVICPENICTEMKLPVNSAVMKIRRRTKSLNCYFAMCESYVYGQRLNVRHILSRMKI